MNTLKDDVDKLLESRQKALEHCSTYHKKRSELEAQLDDIGKRLTEIKGDPHQPLGQKVAALKVSELEAVSCVSQKVYLLKNLFGTLEIDLRFHLIHQHSHFSLLQTKSNRQRNFLFRKSNNNVTFSTLTRALVTATSRTHLQRKFSVDIGRCLSYETVISALLCCCGLGKGKFAVVLCEGPKVLLVLYFCEASRSRSEFTR